jgi:hypothetical protein
MIILFDKNLQTFDMKNGFQPIQWVFTIKKWPKFTLFPKKIKKPPNFHNIFQYMHNQQNKKI